MSVSRMAAIPLRWLVTTCTRCNSLVELRAASCMPSSSACSPVASNATATRTLKRPDPLAAAAEGCDVVMAVLREKGSIRRDAVSSPVLGNSVHVHGACHLFAPALTRIWRLARAKSASVVVVGPTQRKSCAVPYADGSALTPRGPAVEAS